MADKNFEIGLCMAGAVSAGAYTAGVVDFLLEALEEWESRRGKENTPKHKVIIKAIGGASAGGMTGIITASAINNPIKPVKKLEGDLMQQKPDNKLYHSWVDQIQTDMFPLLLETDDIEKGNIHSLLNSKFLDLIADKALKVDSNNWIERPYIDNQMKFFTTLSNLKGFNYSVKFNGNLTVNEHKLSRHSDYATFILNKSQDQYNNDGWIPVNFKEEVNTKIALESALATGAFPIGLRSRKVSRLKSYLNDLIWNKEITENDPINEQPYKSLFVDGGMINNEPFEKIKELLTEKPVADHQNISSTVLMVDPFPSESSDLDINKDSLFNVFGSTVSAALNHLRNKPDVVKKNLDVNNLSQFQIAPTRKVLGKKEEGKKAIACGFLGGFGGFIDKEFRIHDYFLGRANCEQFLREHFTIPKDTSNTIFKDGYEGVNITDFLSSSGERVQIIPIFKKKGEKYIPTFKNGTDWPIKTEEEVWDHYDAVKKRIGKVIMNLDDYNKLTQFLLFAGNRLLLRRKMAKSVMNTIIASMKDFKLIKD